MQLLALEGGVTAQGPKRPSASDIPAWPVSASHVCTFHTGVRTDPAGWTLLLLFPYEEEGWFREGNWLVQGRLAHGSMTWVFLIPEPQEQILPSPENPYNAASLHPLTYATLHSQQSGSTFVFSAVLENVPDNGMLGPKRPIATFETSTCKNGNSGEDAAQPRSPGCGESEGPGGTRVRAASVRERKAAFPGTGKSDLELPKASVSLCET